ncbi:GDSL-type esterase/lipase family protein [Endozoicomonas arenosclerae]|uniref:GDSL-type esterase/lipase family protein n=1 Tax=Endozoicomonas arenosclerae TaxID=1633495 RepID=UPI000783C2CA|nr:GDSL-type esterase/lipase family protein [Endozoicomonas arenosclerae]
MKSFNLKSLFFLVTFFLLTACSSSNQISLTKDSVIVAFGDSLTQGVGTTEENSYPSVLQRELGVQVINEGVSGETSAEGLARLESVLQKYNPDLVILFYGGNDVLQKLPLDQLEQNLDTMIGMIRSYQSEVLLVGVPKPSLLLSPLPLYESLAEKHKLVADLGTLSELLGKRSMKSDTVHLNKAGYESMALSLAERIDVQ